MVVGVAFLVFTPRYGWYAGVLLALIALSGTIEWLPVVFAATYAYVDHSNRDLVIYASRRTAHRGDRRRAQRG